MGRKEKQGDEGGRTGLRHASRFQAAIRIGVRQ
jgi:hypothetical protein